jgi:hypothetical protein
MARTRINQLTVKRGWGPDEDVAEHDRGAGDQRLSTRWICPTTCSVSWCQIAIRPNTRSGAKGFEIKDLDTLTSENYMSGVLKGMDRDKQRLKLIVRDDSFRSFKNAQRLAFLAKIETSVEVFDSREPIRFSKMLLN